MTSQVVPMSDPQQASSTGREARAALEMAVPPSILGLYAFAAATFIVAARMAHWYGTNQSAIVLFPLVLILGGLAQFYAAAWTFRTRDVVAPALHGTWGAFWTAYGILELLYGTGRVTRPQGAFPELGFWFIVIAVITWALTAAAREKIMATFLWLLAIGSSLEAIAELAGAGWLRIVAAYFLIVSALVAWYAASALMMPFVNAGKAKAGIAKTQSESVRAA